jgi:hypothetical protein
MGTGWGLTGGDPVRGAWGAQDLACDEDGGWARSARREDLWAVWRGRSRRGMVVLVMMHRRGRIYWGEVRCGLLRKGRGRATEGEDGSETGGGSWIRGEGDQEEMMGAWRRRVCKSEWWITRNIKEKKTWHPEDDASQLFYNYFSCDYNGQTPKRLVMVIYMTGRSAPPH